MMRDGFQRILSSLDEALNKLNLEELDDWNEQRKSLLPGASNPPVFGMSDEDREQFRRSSVDRQVDNFRTYSDLTTIEEATYERVSMLRRSLVSAVNALGSLADPTVGRKSEFCEDISEGLSTSRNVRQALGLISERQNTEVSDVEYFTPRAIMKDSKAEDEAKKDEVKGKSKARKTKAVVKERVAKNTKKVTKESVSDDVKDAENVAPVADVPTRTMRTRSRAKENQV